MTKEKTENSFKEEVVEKKARGLFFSLILLLGGVFNAVAMLLFLLAILSAIRLLAWDRLTELTSDGYFQNNLIIASFSFLLYSSCLIGVIMMWKQLKKGLYLYFCGFIFLFLMHIFIGQESWLIICAGIVLLFLYFLNKSKLS